MGKLTIVILLHREDKTFHSRHYLIHLLIRAWQSMGYRTEVVTGCARPVAGDVLVPHVDLTELPSEYVMLFDRYPVVVNRELIDISKTRFSEALVTRDDPYGGRVIVKTNRNAGGIPERNLRSRLPLGLWSWPVLQSRQAALLERKIRGWRSIETLVEYPVFSSLRKVPAGVFENPHLVVEKFQPEKEGKRYCLRHYTFLGGRTSNRLSRSKFEMVKGANLFRSEELPAPLPGLERFRRRHALDFGRLDYVMRGETPVVFDVNRTPAYDPADEFFVRSSAHLAAGIRSLVSTRPSGAARV